MGVGGVGGVGGGVIAAVAWAGMVAVGLICIATAQEVLNFPIGPAHNADTWRSNARLGVGCFGAQAWSIKIPYPGRYVILLTRCTDKVHHSHHYPFPA